MRIVSAQDLSCFGKCALGLALPVLSVMGHETALLPTALLSTHTGGLGKPCVTHLCDAAMGALDHWARIDLRFDAALTGYLGSVQAVSCARRLVRERLVPGGLFICDPAMADGGRLYAGLDAHYAQEMTRLCLEADVMLPNATEAQMMLGITPTGEIGSEAEASALVRALRAMGARSVVLKGFPGVGQTLLRADGCVDFLPQLAVCGHYHGTGDLFAAAFCGAYVREGDMEGAARLAGAFVEESVKRTREAQTDTRMGVRFEGALHMLLSGAQQCDEKKGSCT